MFASSWVVAPKQTQLTFSEVPRRVVLPRHRRMGPCVRAWSRVTVGGHTVSVNVVLWGRGGLIGKGVLYTASSDRTTRVWDANEVSMGMYAPFPCLPACSSWSSREVACTYRRDLGLQDKRR